MKKIKDFSPQEEATLVVRLSDVQIRKTTTNVDYASFLVYDGVETIEGKIWNYTDALRETLKSGEVYVASGRMKEYQGKMQFNINDLRLVTEEDGIDVSMFYEYAAISVEELQNSIESYIANIKNPIIQDITVTLVKKYYVNFFWYPAAVNMHHNYYSGLAYHTHTMLQLSDAYLKVYPFVNRDLVVAGVILHDLGKLVELSGPKGTEYTKEGKLLGHISIGANEIYLTAVEKGVEATEEVLNLMHVVLAHHGQLEFGSPKEPMTPEALLVHFLDHTDSKMAALEKEVQKVSKGEYTSPVLPFDRRVFYVPDIN